MRAYRGAGTALLLTLLSGCSTAGGLFSNDPEPAHPVASAAPNQSCIQIAAQRSQDAVMAGYAEDGSADQKGIYDATYRDCVAWQHPR
ncbi:MAG TPA: hypothetical protein VMS78_00200 [Rhizomicrobium sp.]|nr:hypothetical protein [Rhizomicrobium sp.]